MLAEAGSVPASLMSERRRVVVTGTGVISALGQNTAEFWQALASGQSGICELTTSDPNQFRFRYAAEVRGFDPEAHFDVKDLAFLDRFAQFALVAADEAVKQAGVVWTAALRERSAVVTGPSFGACIRSRSHKA